MKTQVRQYHVASGSVYTQVRHYDDAGDFVGEQWEKKSDQRTENVQFAAYVSPAMCSRIAGNYVKYQQLGRYDRMMLRKIVSLGKREHYSGNNGRIVYIAHATTIYTSTRVVRVVPPFDAISLPGDTALADEMHPGASTTGIITFMPPQR
jgi:hypothetical protein